MTRFAVEFDWQPAGKVTIDVAGGLAFPTLSRVPGLYRFWIEGGDGRPGVYVGEASDLRQRMQNYRTPGVSQATNIRLNELLKTALRGGSGVTLSTVTEVTVTLDSDEPRDLPLDRRNARLIAETGGDRRGCRREPRRPRRAADLPAPSRSSRRRRERVRVAVS